MKYMKTKTRTGSFEVSSGRVVFGDPCYETNPGYPALNGVWTAHVVMSDEGSWGTRVRKVIVHHDGFNPADPRIRRMNDEFSVDSGQAGVFDRDSYGGDQFYDLCCQETLSKKQCGYVEGGFVTSSGYGDGCYGARVQTVGGKAVCIELEFLEG